MKKKKEKRLKYINKVRKEIDWKKKGEIKKNA